MRPEGATALWGWSDAQVKAEYRKVLAECRRRASEVELKRAVLDADIAHTERLYFASWPSD